MMLQQNDRSGEKLVVGSLEVIQEFKSSWLTRIESKIDMLDNKMTTEHLKTNDYWSALSDDYILTPVEKKTLKTNLEAEATQYAAIMAEAEKAGAKNTKEVKEYDAYYRIFLNYIYNQLHCFDDMSANTEINDKETFNKMFADLQKYKQAAIDRIALENAKTATHEISKEEIDVDHKGEYLGRITSFPPTTADGVIHKGDYFTWAAETQAVAGGKVIGQKGNENKLIKGHVYRAIVMNDKIIWEELNSTDVYNAKEMTTALGDILSVLQATEDAYYRSVFCSSLLTQSIQMPLAGVIYAGNFDTAQEVKIGNTTTKLLSEQKNSDGKITQYNIAQGGIPKFAKDGKTLNKGFILSGNGDAAFTGIFRGDFLCDLFTVKKETIGANTKWEAKAGDDIFSAVAKLATLVGLNSASYTFTTPQILNGQSVTQFSYSYSPKIITEQGTFSVTTYGGQNGPYMGGSSFYSYTTTYSYTHSEEKITINNRTISRLIKTCTPQSNNRGSRITLEDGEEEKAYRLVSEGQMNLQAQIEKHNSTTYINKTGLALTDNHIFTGRTNISLAKVETVFSFTDDLPKEYRKQLPSGSIYEDAGYLKIARQAETHFKYEVYNNQSYSMNYYMFPNGLLIHFGLTCTIGDNGNCWITFKKKYAFEPIVICSPKDNRWSKGFARDISKIGCSISQQKDESGKDTVSQVFYLAIGQAESNS